MDIKKLKLETNEFIEDGYTNEDEEKLNRSMAVDTVYILAEEYNREITSKKQVDDILDKLSSKNPYEWNEKDYKLLRDLTKEIGVK